MTVVEDVPLVDVSDLFRAIGFAMDRLSQPPGKEERLEEVLGVLGRAARAHRVCLCTTTRIDSGLRGELVKEWSSPAAGGRREGQAFVLDELGLGDVSAALEAEVPMVAVISESSPASARPWLCGMRSFLFLPILFDGEPWGFLGVEDVRSERGWREVEIEGLAVAAKVVGRTIRLRLAGDATRESEERLCAALEHVPVAVLKQDRERRSRRLEAGAFDVELESRDVDEIVALNEALHAQVEMRDFALLEKDALLEAVASEVPGVLFQTAVDDAGQLLARYVGPGLERLGLEIEGPESLPEVGLLPPAGEVESLRQLADGAGCDLPEWRREWAVDRGGSTGWLRSVARPVRVQGEIRFSGVLLDVTAEREAVESLRASEARLRAVSDALPVGLFLEERGRVTYVNETFEGLLGPPRFGSDVVESIHPEDRTALRETLDATGAPPYRRTLEVRAPYANEQWLRVNAAAVRDEERHIGVVGVLDDVTNARRLAQETMDALVRSEELHRLKTRVLSTVSHEFRTPLTAIDMATQYLESNPPSDDRARRSVQRIRRALGTFSGIMEEILMYARIESGRLEVRPERIGLARLLRSVVEDLAATTVRERVDLMLSPEIGGLRITTDPRLVRTALSNIIANAIKYSRDEVIVSASLSEERVIVEVNDRGIGVVTDEIEVITQPFIRGSNVVGPGTGLGLSIARSALDALGGRLEIVSRSGEGTRAVLEVPTG